MHPKKIIKLDPLQQTLFGLPGQQIRLTQATMSVADDSDLDNENPQFQTEPIKQQTKKSLCFILRLVKTEKMSVPYYVSQVLDHLSQKLVLWKHFHKPVACRWKHFLNISVLIDSGTIVSYFSGSFLERIKASHHYLLLLNIQLKYMY